MNDELPDSAADETIATPKGATAMPASDGEAEALPRLFGAYTLKERLGEGAAGIVYRARHRELDRDVALKILRLSLDPAAHDRFRREARACARVRHPQIVEIYEVGDVEGLPYYAMGLLDGSTLADWLTQEGPDDLAEVCRRMAGLAEALEELHAAGFIHRDIKPTNIMVAEDGRFILADFGLARSAQCERVTRTGEIVGTPLYMSPEQVLGKREIDARTDVYSLGATLFEAVTGRAPFEKTELQALLRSILKERPPAPSAVAPRVPTDLDRILLKCLEKQPSDRYATVADLGRDLQRFADGLTVEGRPVSRLQRTGRFVLAHRPAFLAGAAIAAGLILWSVFAPEYSVIRISSVSSAMVSVDGGPPQPAPMRLELERGTAFDVEITAPDFLTARLRRTADEDSVHISDCLMPSSRASFAALQEFQACRGIEVTVLEPMTAQRMADLTRGTNAEYALPIYPRGPVRLEDLSSYRLELGDQYYGEGPIRFWIDGEAVAEVPAEEPINLGRLPAALLERLSPGVEVTWGLDPASPYKAPRASFRVVSDPGAASSAGLEKALEGASPDVRAFFEAQALAAHDLRTAALGVLRRARAEQVPGLQSLLLEARLLRELLDGEADLDSTKAWEEVATQFDKMRTDD